MKQPYIIVYFNCIFSLGTFYAYIISSLFNHSVIHRDSIINHILGQQIECTHNSRNLMEFFEGESFLNAKCFSDFFMVSSKRFLHNKHQGFQTCTWNRNSLVFTLGNNVSNILGTELFIVWLKCQHYCYSSGIKCLFAGMLKFLKLSLCVQGLHARPVKSLFKHIVQYCMISFCFSCWLPS